MFDFRNEDAYRDNSEPCWDEEYDDEGFHDDVEADADTLASAGYGTDEDYGLFGDFNW